MQLDTREVLALLHWYMEAGVDAAVGETAADFYALAPQPKRVAEVPADKPPAPAAPPAANTAPRRAAPQPAAATSQTARALAAAAPDLAALKDALAGFNGCSLRETAMNLVFADGNPDSDLMIVGEAPGADEDRQGLPFVGLSGQLLDRMLATIGRDRRSVYISNILPWRPPGNRKPTAEESEACLPFIRRHIELVGPKVLVLLGGTAASALLGTTAGITRLRGKWLEYETQSGVIATMPTFHPAYLLRSPALKQKSWQDFLAIRNRLTA